MIKAALRHGVGVTVVVLILAIFGILALFRVPVQMTPDLTPTSISIATVWPGATPQDIEKEILIEQEDFLRALPNLKKMTSRANTGRGEIVLEFNVGTSLDEVLVRAQNALSQVPSYPENVDQPRILTVAASDQPIAWFSLRPLPGNPQNVDIVAMQDFAEDYIKTEFERTSGISQSEVFGGAQRQLRVIVDPGKLSERGITVNELRNALRARNRDVSGGDFDEGKRRYLIRTIGRFSTAEDVESALIAERNGGPVYLRDVGHVDLFRGEMRSQVRHNGEIALAMNARREPGTNIIEVMNQLQATVAKLNEGLLQENGLILRQVADETTYIRESVRLVRDNLMIGGFLACVMLFLFLRSIPATLIGAVSVPICTVAAFLGLTLTGRTVNVISLAGVAFAVGMVLDASIVVLENIYRHRTMGKGLYEAAYDGVSEVWGAVLASTLTTVFVFLPIVFVKEEAGQLFADIAIAVSSAIVASMMVAITVIPSASARLLKRIGHEPRTIIGRTMNSLFGLVAAARLFNRFAMGTVEFLMGGVLRRIALVAGLIIFSIGTTILLFPQTEYLPEGRKNLVFAFMYPPPGYNITEMTDIGQQIENDFLPYLDDSPEDFASGKTDVPAIQDFFFVNTTSFVIVISRTKDGAQMDDLIPKLMARINQLPGVFGFATRPSIFPGDLLGNRALDIDIRGADLAPLFDVAREGFQKARQVMEGADVRPDPPSLSLGQPMLEIRPDWQRAQELGIDTQSLGYLVWALADGAYLDEFFLEDDKIDMYLYSTLGTVKSIGDLENLSLYSTKGGVVPLSSVAKIVPNVSTETIRRVDRRRTVTLSIKPPQGVALETAVEITENEIIASLRDEGKIPAGVDLRIAGASDKLKATREALGGNFVLAILICYLLMVALFSHWGYPLIIMTSVPLGMLGGLVGLHLLNHGGDYFGFLGVHNILQPLDVITMLGFVILVGTVVNNPILIVEQALINIRTEGMSPIAAVVESTRTRIRPMMMSTLTTSFGLSPLVFNPGSGAELYRGLGTVVLFGLFFSTFFSLTFIPSLLSLFLQFGEKFHLKRVAMTERLDHVIPLRADETPAPLAPQRAEEQEEEPAAR